MMMSPVWLTRFKSTNNEAPLTATTLRAHVGGPMQVAKKPAM